MSDFTEYENYDALGLARLVRDGDVSAGEVLDAAIARAGARNPRINALCHDLHDRARAAIGAGLPDGPFAGVNFGSGGGSGIGLPVRRVLPQVRDEPVSIRIVGVNLAVRAKNQRIGGPDQRRAIGHRVSQRQDGLFVGDRHVHPDKARPRQDSQNLGKMFRHDRQRHVMAVDAIPTQPVAVQLRGTRMRDRHADDAGKRRVSDRGL